MLQTVRIENKFLDNEFILPLGYRLIPTLNLRGKIAFFDTIYRYRAAHTISTRKQIIVNAKSPSRDIFSKKRFSSFF
jgi:hypothetical protein